MVKGPLISVVVPTHNRPDFLRKTLESILSQTYANLEIFVISNGVNPNNKAMVESLNDSRIIYRDQENSGGPSSPRNYGIKLSKGKYLAFCDDDDLWEEDKLEKQICALEENPTHGLCYSKMMRFDEAREWAIAHEEGQATFASLLYVNTVPISSLIVRKSLIDHLGGFSEDPRVGASEDYEFLLRYAAKSKLYFIDKYLIRYWSGNNRTTSFNAQAKKLWSYYAYILFIFNKVKKYHHLPLYIFIRPALHHLFVILKILLHKNISFFGLTK
ncbi:MAG: glycosyltransferase family 2 protein [Alphaproteobacteria bacterium]|nr:glycosyltransferase family 2 protein [Alphaproteobacteria bacterium]MBX9976738.1 glycosyltransferase family 2 protein [Alphaproteobacteria bacterium]